MAIILDADVIIRGEKGMFKLTSWLHTQSEEFQVAAITIAELWHGVERASSVAQKERRLQYLSAIVGELPIIPYSEQTAYEHARIWAELESKGSRIGYYDLIVAATALEHGSQVATFNRRHFDFVPGLKVIEPQVSSD
jgi:tRNA(fMet)-specific endonuclease VapC